MCPWSSVNQPTGGQAKADLGTSHMPGKSKVQSWAAAVKSTRDLSDKFRLANGHIAVGHSLLVTLPARGCVDCTGSPAGRSQTWPGLMQCRYSWRRLVGPSSCLTRCTAIDTRAAAESQGFQNGRMHRSTTAVGSSRTWSYCLEL